MRVGEQGRKKQNSTQITSSTDKNLKIVTKTNRLIRNRPQPVQAKTPFGRNNFRQRHRTDRAKPNQEASHPRERRLFRTRKCNQIILNSERTKYFLN